MYHSHKIRLPHRRKKKKKLEIRVADKPHSVKSILLTRGCHSLGCEVRAVNIKRKTQLHT